MVSKILYSLTINVKQFVCQKHWGVLYFLLQREMLTKPWYKITSSTGTKIYLHLIILKVQITMHKMGKTYSMYVGDAKCVQRFI